MSDQTAMDLVGAPARQNASTGDDTGVGKSWMVKKTKKAGRSNKPTTTTTNTASANNPLAHHLTTSHPPTKPNHRAQQPTAVPVPPLSQITASRLGLEILNNSATEKDQAGASMVDTIGAQSSKRARRGIVGTQNQDQKEDWLRPDTVTSTAEDDRLLATQTRFLKRRLDTMREDAEEGDSVNAKEQRVAGEGGEQKPSFSIEEALTLGRPGSEKAYLKERLEYNLLEREGLLRRFREL